MIPRKEYDVLVVGGGPAGLAAALASAKEGARVGLIEREERLGGILKQCVHDGFGLVRFGERLAGPEYARRFVDQVAGSGIDVHLETFVHAARRGPETGYALECVSRAEGVFVAAAPALVLATGCRERTDRQVFIHGDRPAGVLTAGLAQHLVNIEGLLPGKRAVILGSGDIGLIMARRLTLEGMEVEGVYELKSEPSGLSRNIAQCLDDFGIPLHLSTTVTEVHGHKRVEAVTVAKVDRRGTPLPGTERRVECDTLVLSVGLIPENELASSLGLSLDPATKGPRVDQDGEVVGDAARADGNASGTAAGAAGALGSGSPAVPAGAGLFVCGNALHVNDLVDYVSESGEAAGKAAACHAAAAKAAGGARDGAAARAGMRVQVKGGSGFLYVVPQFIDTGRGGTAVVYFRVNSTRPEGGLVRASAGDRVLLEKRYAALRPPEMERLEIDMGAIPEGTAALALELVAKEETDGREP